MAADGKDVLSVTDERTGETYELPITDGTIRAPELRQIKVSEDDFGLMSYDPAFLNTASLPQRDHLDRRRQGRALVPRHTRSSSSASRAPISRSPTCSSSASCRPRTSSTAWIHDITHHTYVHENIKKFVEGFRYDAHPMGMLLASVGALSTFYPDAKHIKDPEERYMATIRMIAKMPTLAAFAYRHNLGLPYVYPDNDLDYPGNFLSMMFKMTELKYDPDPRLARALDVLCDPARRPRAELLDERCARRRLVPGRPVLGGRGRRRRPLRPAARRRQRGGR